MKREKVGIWHCGKLVSVVGTVTAAKEFTSIPLRVIKDAIMEGFAIHGFTFDYILE
jgi:hypothetical protein